MKSEQNAAADTREGLRQYALLFAVFVIASCGLAYELIAGALSSYLLGDSVTQFSTVIGAYLFAMGIGSYLSRYVTAELVRRFVQIELMVGLLGGFSSLALFLLFAYVSEPFKLALYLLVLLTGVLVGLEIPLVMRILKERLAFETLVAEVLTFDYLGALLVSLAFPLVLVPQVGLVRSGLLFGLLNAAVALWTVRLFAKDLPARHGLHAQCGVALALLVAGLGGAERLSALAEQNIYADTIVYAKSTPYQRMVLTRWKDDLRLFLNGNLQFSSQDEYRYHEALVHPGMASVRARRVLVLGGGDGLALRELLKYPELESIQLVDLDAEMTRLFSTAPFLRRLNGDAFASPKVKVANEDALLWLERTAETFDFIVVDFPDPSNFAVGKLYTTAFYRLLEKHLSSQGLAVIQATSPYYARQSYWCVVATLEEAGLATTPYHAMVPSFGEWGYILAGRRPVTPPTAYAVATRFLTADSAPQLFQFPKDMQRVPAEPNRLNNQVLVRYFEEEWRRVLH